MSLNNALTVIAGHCELILEQVEAGSECSNRLHQILVIAHATAKRINGHECRMSFALAQNIADQDVAPVPHAELCETQPVDEPDNNRISQSTIGFAIPRAPALDVNEFRQRLASSQGQ